MTSALEMRDAVLAAGRTDVFASAWPAVADYRPLASAGTQAESPPIPLNIALTPIPTSSPRSPRHADAPFCVGFAAETSRPRRLRRGQTTQ